MVEFGVTEQMKFLSEQGFDLEPLARFVANVALNPDKSIARDLYPFLEKGKHPITEDGCFLAWKNVSENFYSFTSGNETWTVTNPAGVVIKSGIGGRVWHPVGNTVSLRREECDPSRNNTCSRGLHACSYGYLPGYMGGPTSGRTLLVKIDPSKVTAFPTSDEPKLRCCEYEILDQIAHELVEGRLKGGIDREYPEPIPVDWTTEGYNQGRSDGYDAQAHEAEYDAVLKDDEYPDECVTGRERTAFLSGYLSGYDEGWEHFEVKNLKEEDEEEEEDTVAVDPNEYDLSLEDDCRAAGVVDGRAYAEGDTLYDPDVTEGTHYYEIPTVHGNAYAAGFHAGYAEGFAAENGN